MKYRSNWWGYCLIVLLLFGKNVDAKTLIITGDRLNLRAGPGRTYDILDVLQKNERYEVLEEQDGWYRINVEGTIGWVSENGVTLASSAQIQTLLAQADDYFIRQQFTTPPGENAFDLYMQALEQEPDNARALARIAQIAKTYKTWADVAYQDGDRHKARIFYERYLYVAPGDKDVETRLKQLDEQPEASANDLRILQLRQQPMRLSADQIVRLINANQFHHPADWSKYGLAPSLTGSVRHDYAQKEAQGVQVVIDYATHLMWPQVVPEQAYRWQDASKFIDQRNAAQFAGFSDWRLPTVEELASLLEAKKTKYGLYLAPFFGDTPRWCWSADLTPDAQSAWYVSFNSGGIQQQPLEQAAFVLAVRTFNP
ncbi:hypothetical protein U14_04756 [Candidatus Moduliflexus flocculans]|uniref:SH3b domain-containing protein n=1 Tax=Candidatus Moduliflexus flocculans TaxID=1499966 RepID=A0A0S6W5U2_9BACT|nr:hypothetical protein U14_04756 [Candidatus Moduliflexus flocculans]